MCSNAVFKESKRLTMSEHRGQKQHKIEDIGDMFDRISNLPDCILHHILSFMPTKEVVKTSILSIRWKNLWAFGPNLDFADSWSCTRPPEMTSFVNFVERVLRLRDALNAEKFRLSCYVYNNASKIHSWISYAIMHNVQELDLCLYGGDPSVIPHSMFDSTSLVSLKIRINFVIELPSHVSFPCLKTLHLSLIRSPDDDFTEKLFSGCPFLEELVLTNCCLVNLNNIMIPQSMFDGTSLVSLKIMWNYVIELPSHVSFPCLKTLNLSYVQFTNDDFTEKLFSGCTVLQELVLFECCSWNLENIAISSSTLKSLTIHDLSHFTGYKFKIVAANLTYFNYVGYLSNEIILNDISSLDKAFINISILRERLKEVAARAIDLLKQLRFVVSLKLYIYNMEYLFADNISVCFPVFPNLTHLMLSMESRINHTFRIVMALLSFCPVLQSICFPLVDTLISELKHQAYDDHDINARLIKILYMQGLRNSFMHREENNSIWYSIPICISNCLKTVTFRKFHGNSSEICFIKGVLKYARLLERMDIQWSETYPSDLERKTKVRNELEKIGRSSAACVIKFS